MESGNNIGTVPKRQVERKEQEAPDRYHIIVVMNIAMLFFTVFWFIISSSYYYYGNDVNTNSLRAALLMLNAGSAVCFLLSLIGASLGFSRLIGRKLAVKLSAIPMILGFILLINSILIYAYLTVSRMQPYY